MRIAVLAVVVACSSKPLFSVQPHARVLARCGGGHFAIGSQISVHANWSATCYRGGVIDADHGYDCAEASHQQALECGNPGCAVHENAYGFNVELMRAGPYALTAMFTRADGERATVPLRTLFADVPNDLRVNCGSITGKFSYLTVSLLAGRKDLCGTITGLKANGEECHEDLEQFFDSWPDGEPRWIHKFVCPPMAGQIQLEATGARFSVTKSLECPDTASAATSLRSRRRT